ARRRPCGGSAGRCSAAPALGVSAASRLRARQFMLLIRPTARASDWLTPIAGAVLAVALDRVAGPISASFGLELAAIALALGVSFAFDDAASVSIAASPVPLGLRYAVRGACALPIPAAVWIVLASSSGADNRSMLTLALAGLVAQTLAIAAVGT